MQRSKENSIMTAKSLIAFLTGNTLVHDGETRSLSGQRGSMQSRQPELAGRGPERRAAIREARIEEARDYLDGLLRARQKLGQVQIALPRSGRLEMQARTLEQVAFLLTTAGKTRYRIESLDDDQLVELNERLQDALCDMHRHLLQFVLLARQQESIHADVVRGVTSEKAHETSTLLRHMQERLRSLE
jgi:hypothetical protein